MAPEAIAQLATRFDPEMAVIEGSPQAERRLSDLRGMFADCRIGKLRPGQVEAEYYSWQQ